MAYFHKVFDHLRKTWTFPYLQIFSILMQLRETFPYLNYSRYKYRLQDKQVFIRLLIKMPKKIFCLGPKKGVNLGGVKVETDCTVIVVLEDRQKMNILQKSTLAFVMH